MNAHQKFEAALSHIPLVAILRGVQAHEALAVGEAISSTGWSLIEPIECLLLQTQGSRCQRGARTLSIWSRTSS